MNLEVEKLLRLMVKFKASDLHIKVNQPPAFRVNGSMSRMKNTEPLTPEQCDELLLSLLSDNQRRELQENGNVDFSYYIEDAGRYRCNVYKQCGYLSAAIRMVNAAVPSMDDLMLPPQMAKVPEFQRGLVVVGGITGAGKSTTLASVLNVINKQRRCHIITLEDPIEYIFEEDQSFINQREIGLDVKDFKDGLRSIVRQDPDVILVGEMRDAETFETALSAAETGHLVLGTVHASSCAQTIGRILDLFPIEKQTQIRTSLAFNLKAIFNQQLLKSEIKSTPRIPAVESMFITPLIRKLIEEKEDSRIAGAVQQDTENGCESYNQTLLRMQKAKQISMEVALKASPNPDELRIAMRGISVSGGGIA